MADARSIILHHYDRSPFSEKVRLYLRMKNLGWTSVEIPNVMPKPDLMPLTGGYRRTPVMQIGADIYCDTAMILMELERRFPLPALNLPGHEGLAKMVASWADRIWFQVSVGVIFGTIGDHVPEAFKQDRAALMGRPFDTDAMKAAAPMLRDQWRAHLMTLEERLEGGRGAGSGNWLISTKPGLVDVHAHMNIWFVEQHVADFVAQCFEGAPLALDWYTRMKAFEGQQPEALSSTDALAIATRAGPRLKAATVDGLEPQGLVLGEPVAVAPEDYGRDWVTGALVHADDQCVILQRTDAKAESIHIHFPRAGYMVRRG
ncbi:MAG: glutathione S-transferase [Hyphomonadaceae bacterium]|nr:glutathione S-transferase [Hyphomonadaceae bacterium]